MFLFSIGYHEEKAFAPDEEGQITWGKGKAAYFHLLLWLLLFLFLSQWRRDLHTHRAKHCAPCNTSTRSNEHRPPWNLPSNPVTLRISVTYTAMTLRPLAAPSARNRITISKNCWSAETCFTFWTRKQHCDVNNPVERRRGFVQRSKPAIHTSASPQPSCASSWTVPRRRTETNVHHTDSEQPRQSRSRAVWRAGRVSYRHLLHDSHEDCPSTSAQQSSICQFVSVSLYLKPVLERYGWIKGTWSPPHKAHISSHTFIYYCSDIVLHTGII